MIYHKNITKQELYKIIKNKKITIGGNINAKPQPIYGTLKCSQGKRLRKEYRVFFLNEGEAIRAGFRPCGSCMQKEFNEWRVKNQ